MKRKQNNTNKKKHGETAVMRRKETKKENWTKGKIPFLSEQKANVKEAQTNDWNEAGKGKRQKNIRIKKRNTKRDSWQGRKEPNWKATKTNRMWMWKKPFKWTKNKRTRAKQHEWRETKWHTEWKGQNPNDWNGKEGTAVKKQLKETGKRVWARAK